MGHLSRRRSQPEQRRQPVADLSVRFCGSSAVYRDRAWSWISLHCTGERRYPFSRGLAACYRVEQFAARRRIAHSQPTRDKGSTSQGGARGDFTSICTDWYRPRVGDAGSGVSVSPFLSFERSVADAHSCGAPVQQSRRQKGRLLQRRIDRRSARRTLESKWVARRSQYFGRPPDEARNGYERPGTAAQRLVRTRGKRAS